MVPSQKDLVLSGSPSAPHPRSTPVTMLRSPPLYTYWTVRSSPLRARRSTMGLSSAFDTDQFLSFPGLSLTWTGSSSDGMASPDHALGQASPVIGTFVPTDASWLDSGVGPANERLRLYAISEELTVPTQSVVPEPATLLSWLLMGGGGLSLFYCCRWRTRAKACE